MNRYRRSPLSAREAVGLDVAIAIGVGCLGVWRELSQEPEIIRLIHLPMPLRVAVQIAGAALLLWRRQYPYPVGIGTALLCLLAPTQSASVAVYSVAAHGTDRRRVSTVIGMIVVAFYLGGEVWRLADPFAAGFVLGFGAVLGLYVRARRDLLAAAVDRADAAEQQQQWRAERAVAAERARLAGDMHDVLSHRLSMLMLQAGAVAGTIQDSAIRQSVEELRNNSAAALAELRDVFGTLEWSEDGAGLPSDGVVDGSQQPGSACRSLGEQVRELVGQWQRTGAVVSLDAPELPDPLSPTVVRTAFRVVQEALTNAAKHAAGAEVAVRLSGCPSGLNVVVSNGAATRSPDQLVRTAGGGRGLAGLAERVSLVGGSFAADTRGDGGFELTARLPSSPRLGTEMPAPRGDR